MVTIQTAEKALKSCYLDAVTEALDHKVNPFLAMIEKTTRDVWGKDVKMLVKYGMNGGIGAGTEDGKLPTASGNNYAQITATLKNLYGTIEITDKAIRASQNNEGAFVDLLNAEMDGIIRASVFNFGRMLFGDGTGVLATVTGINNGEISLSSVKDFQVGMVIDVKTAAGADITVAKGRTVLAINYETKTIKVSGNALSSTTCPVGGLVVMQGSYGLELTGLKAIFDTSKTDLYGLSRADNTWLNPVVKQSEKIDELTVQTYIDEVDMLCGSKVDVILCSPGVRRALMKELSDKKMYLDARSIEGGCPEITFNGIPVIVDRFCPEGTMYLLNSKDFALHQLCDWQWLEDEDGRVLTQIAGKAAYTATLVKYAELICSRPCGQAMITGIIEA